MGVKSGYIDVAEIIKNDD